MKVVIFSPKNRTVYNFRGDLIETIIANGHQVKVTGPNDMYADKIKALGASLEVIPLNKSGINPLADIRYFFRLVKSLKYYKPDITFGYTIKPVIYGAIAAKICGIKHIVSMVTGVGYLFIAGSIKARVLKIIAMGLYRIGFKCANTVIFQNSDDRHEFIENKLLKKDKAALVNGSGVNMQHFNPTPLPKDITFFMLARVMIAKGINEYLTAAKVIKQEFPNTRFMLLGACENTHNSISKNDLKHFIDDGIIDYYDETEDVRRYYSECSIFVLPSYREGTPRTVLEAMSMKRPIITTDVPGCRETVKNGVTGFLVPVKDSKVLADKMRWFIKNPDKITEMGNASYTYCLEKFDVKKVNENMIKLLKLERSED